MTRSDIITSTLSEFFERNNINFSSAEKDIVVDDPQMEVDLVPSDKFSTDVKMGKLTICGDVSSDYDQIYKELVRYSDSMKVDMSELAKIDFEIWRKIDRYIEGNEIFEETIPELGITFDDEYVYCNRRIDIQTIIYGRRIYLADSLQMRELDYGIKSFKINNLHEFDGAVFCEGNHPNIDGIGLLCRDHPNVGEQISRIVLHKIMTMLAVANLDSCNNFDDHIKKIAEAGVLD